jgi:hypothetical protein
MGRCIAHASNLRHKRSSQFNMLTPFGSNISQLCCEVTLGLKAMCWRTCFELAAFREVAPRPPLIGQSMFRTPSELQFPVTPSFWRYRKRRLTRSTRRAAALFVQSGTGLRWGERRKLAITGIPETELPVPLAVGDDHVLEGEIEQSAQRGQGSLLMPGRRPDAQFATWRRQSVGENQGTNTSTSRTGSGLRTTAAVGGSRVEAIPTSCVVGLVLGWAST